MVDPPRQLQNVEGLHPPHHHPHHLHPLPHPSLVAEHPLMVVVDLGRKGEHHPV